MTHRRNPLPWLVLAAGSLVAMSYAVAQPPTQGQLTITHPVTGAGTGTAPTQPLVIHDPYSESAHFVVRHLHLEGQGPTAHVQPGATVHGQVEINVHCTACATPHNHLLLGFPGQQQAATCAWSGMRESGGWRTESVSFIAPMQPGVYPLRIRSASTATLSCDDATLSYWTRDLPAGPGPDATIGVLVVEAPRATTTTTSGSGGVTSTTTVTSSSVVPTGPGVIANASFEQPDVASGQAVPMASILGWARTAGSGVEVHDQAAGHAANGQQWVELDGIDSSAIATEIGTNAGGNYLVTLAFAARPGTSSIDNRLEVRWNGETVAVLATSGEGQSDTTWTRVSLRVRASGATSRLELRDAGASNGQGTYVDDVSIAPTN